MDLSIIIVNWNSASFLDDCLAALLSRRPGFGLEILVVDSGSFDGSERVTARYRPHARHIQCETNVGFAHANNLGAEAARGRLLLFLNPDTVVLDDAVQQLYEFVERRPDTIVGAKLLNTDGSVQKTCIRRFPTLLNQALECDLLRRRFPSSALWGMAPLFDGRQVPVPVDAISGACMMMRRDVFMAAGGFTTDYFMYSEDLDLCHKAAAIGVSTYYLPTSEIIHHGGQSSSRNPVSEFASVMFLESRRRFFARTRSKAYSHLYRVEMALICALRLLATALVWPYFAMKGDAGWLRAVRRKWLAKMRWTMGGERWSRTYPLVN